MSERMAVIGAGMVGVSVAWHLQQQGFQVTLIDRKEAGEETSFGNAGLIQREAIFPYPMPRSLNEIISILPNQRADIRYRPQALWHYRKALWQYFCHSHPQRFDTIQSQWAPLIAHATDTHQQMMSAAGAAHLVRKVGWLQLHRQEHSFQHAKQHVQMGAKWGVEARLLSTEQIQELEPDLNASVFVGGVHWLNAWQVTDPSALVKAYAHHFVQSGGEFLQDAIDHLSFEDSLWHIQTAKTTRTFTHVVVAAGPWSQQLLAPLGYHFPLFPMRGYHQHYRLKAGAVLNHSIVDEDQGFVLGPKRAGIRLTTGAEMTLMDAPQRLEQLSQTEAIARNLLPLQDAVEAEVWHGHRPCLPDMKPVMGKAHLHERLYLAFGHAHQGFTLGPITGKLLAQVIQGQQTSVDLTAFASDRF